MNRTFVDAGVLIAATRGPGPISAHAIAILDDRDREFVSSVFVQLEVLPKAIFNQRRAESQFYRTFFNAVREWANPDAVCSLSLEVASESGLSALDALHVAAAALLDATELATTELPGKPLYRTRRVKVIPFESIRR